MKKKLICLLLAMFLLFSTFVPISAAEDSAQKIWQQTGDYLERQCQTYPPNVSSVGGEWAVLGLVRSGREEPAGYYDNVAAYVNENINEYGRLHRSKSTDNSRVILALTACGYDVTNVNGHNLLAGLADMTYVKKQGINGPIWALIAFDSGAYEIPENTDSGEQVTREALVDYILSVQLADGGWTLSGENADPDMTGMAIQALASYYETNPDVKTALDKAINCMSELQNADGGYSTAGAPTSESSAQIIVALTALGIDPDTDSRFIKNGTSVLDALCAYAVNDGGFEHSAGEGLDGMATEQGYYALTAYFRFKNGKTSLYDMADVKNPCVKGHTEVTDEGKDATCTETGLTEGKHCSVCGTVIVKQETIPASGHRFVNGVCSICGAEDPDYVEPTEPEPTEPEPTEPEPTEPEPTEPEPTEPEPTEPEPTEPEPTEPEPTEPEPTEPVSTEPEPTTPEPSEPEEMPEMNFSDVKQGKWYHSHVEYVYQRGLMSGVSATSFAPNATTTRAMVVTILYSLEGKPEVTAKNRFTDVKSGSWYEKAVIWAAENGIVSGYGNGKFGPNDPVTREQMAVILYGYSRLNGQDMSASGDLNRFADQGKISGYAVKAMTWAVGEGMFSGNEKGQLCPKDTATRAEVATILHNYLEN